MADAFGVDREVVSKGMTKRQKQGVKEIAAGSVLTGGGAAGLALNAPRFRTVGGKVGTLASLGLAGMGGLTLSSGSKKLRSKVKKSEGEDESKESEAHEMAEEKSEGKEKSESCDCKGCGGKHKKDCTCDKCYEAKKKG